MLVSELRAVIRFDDLLELADKFKNEYHQQLNMLDEEPVEHLTDYEAEFSRLLTYLLFDAQVPDDFSYLSDQLIDQLEAMIEEVTRLYPVLDEHKLIYVKKINSLILEPIMGYSNLVVGAVVNFEVIPSAIIKTKYDGVTVVGIVDANTARSYEDVAGKHQQVKAYLPPGSPSFFTDYNYVLVKLPSDNSVHAIGLPWIKEPTIVLSSKRSYSFICDNVEPSQLESIRQIMIKNGITVRSVTIHNS